MVSIRNLLVASPLPRGTALPAVLLLVMLGMSAFDGLRVAGDEQLAAASNRALATFAIARAINGVISVIQETQIGFSVGVSTTVAPGQLLDPLNDLIERFSTAALIAATALWAMRLLGDLLFTPWVPLALLGLLLVRIGLDRCTGCVDFNQILIRAVRMGIVVWLFAAITPWAISGVHDSSVVQGHYEQATRQMDAARQQLNAFGSIQDILSIDSAKIRDTVGQLVTMTDRLSEQAIIVLAVYVFEIVLLPMAIFWFSARLLLGYRASGADIPAGR